MKKNLILLIGTLLLVTALTGCGSDLISSDVIIKNVHSKYIDMELVEEYDGYDIYRDTNTNVLYLVVGGYSTSLITPILNSDGTPKLYEE